MDLGLKGKHALVMGASSGIGKAIAAILSDEGARVAICARGRERLESAAREIDATPFVCDLSKPGAAAGLVRAVAGNLGRVDILVCNTGGPPSGGFLDLDQAAWQRGFDSLWMSTVEGMREALPAMKERRWGRCLVVTSVAAREPVAGLTISNALRPGLLGLVNTISREVAPFNVTVNSLLPGYTNTERLAELGIPEEELSSRVPARRLGRPEELASLAAFLASDRGAYVTGQAIAVDGGLLWSI